MRPVVAYVGFASLLFICTATTGQDKSVRPDINKSFQKPDSVEFVKKFEIESREVYQHRQVIVEKCGFKPGMAVADIGAGTGLFTRQFASVVGPQGKVFAVDIAQNFLDHIAKTCKEQKLENVVGVRCDQTSCKLEPNSIDAAYVCDTYHHFEFPFKTLDSIHKALKPGGKLIVVDFKRIPGVTKEWTMNHVRAGQPIVEDEIKTAGFRKIEEVKTPLEENYFVRFEKAEVKPR